MQDQQQPGWTFSPGQQPQTAAPAPQPNIPAPTTPSASDGAITWSASEFVEHDKAASWYIGFLFIAVLGIGAVYLVTRDLFSVITLSLFAVAFMTFAARKPKVLSYSLSENGIQVGEKFYTLGQFKSFSVIDEGMIRSISLLPLKRFMPAINIYFAPDDENKIAGFLGARLPHEERQQDAIDRFMHKIRF
jgi:hypothetical protein